MMETNAGVQTLLVAQEYFHAFNNSPEPWDGDISIIDGDLHMYGNGEWTNIEMKTKLIIIDEEEHDIKEYDITDDVRWKERFGTSPPTKKQYVPRNKCVSFWAWLSYSWNFINAQGYREIGRRFLGRETIYYFVVPRGELRF